MTSQISQWKALRNKLEWFSQNPKPYKGVLEREGFDRKRQRMRVGETTEESQKALKSTRT